MKLLKKTVPYDKNDYTHNEREFSSKKQTKRSQSCVLSSLEALTIGTSKCDKKIFWNSSKLGMGLARVESSGYSSDSSTQSTSFSSQCSSTASCDLGSWSSRIPPSRGVCEDQLPRHKNVRNSEEKNVCFGSSVSERHVSSAPIKNGGRKSCSSIEISLDGEHIFITSSNFNFPSNTKEKLESFCHEKRANKTSECISKQKITDEEKFETLTLNESNNNELLYFCEKDNSSTVLRIAKDFNSCHSCAAAVNAQQRTKKYKTTRTKTDQQLEKSNIVDNKEIFSLSLKENSKETKKYSKQGKDKALMKTKGDWVKSFFVLTLFVFCCKTIRRNQDWHSRQTLLE